MTIRQKMEQPKSSELKPNWHVLDAEAKTLGRISSEIAVLLQGKHKPGYVPYLNTGDYVIVVNAEKIHVTGKKIEQKKYYRHSGYHGGLKETSLQQMLEKHPERVIKQSVKGMLPKNVPGRRMLGRLKVYAGNNHPHQAQVNSEK
ncbi:50S ribosomal protein L13 [Chloroflexi bacterium]|nr:50S ribosomal protein L13 [Chloroflexota bacterium]